MSYYHTISVNSGISAICAASLPPLSREEEKKIIPLAKRGNRKAKDILFRSNIRYVATIAKKYQNKGLEFDELVVEGYLALEDSLRKFSAEKDSKFITFAKWDILNSIPKAINDCGYTIRQSKHNLSNAIKNKTNFLSLDACDDSDDEENLLSHISDDRIFSPEDESLRSLTKEKVKQAVSKLPKDEYEIITMHYGLGNCGKEYSFSEIAPRFNRTKQWVCIKCHEAEKKLRQNLSCVA